MSNMSYCLFENTLPDLQECYESLVENNESDLSQTELGAKKAMIELCCIIAGEFGEQKKGKKGGTK